LLFVVKRSAENCWHKNGNNCLIKRIIIVADGGRPGQNVRATADDEEVMVEDLSITEDEDVLVQQIRREASGKNAD
jgi:hypothetical protein